MNALAEQFNDYAATDGAMVHVNDLPTKGCSRCGKKLSVLKTTKHHGKTLAHGRFLVVETVYSCPDCIEKTADGKRKKHLCVKRQDELTTLLIPRTTIGYDVMVFCGIQRYLKQRQREEIQVDLERKFGIRLSTGKISDLERTFTVYLKTLHESKAQQIRGALGAGYPLHFDSTSETGRGTLFVAYCGTREWVLGAWKIPTERADAILPKLKIVESLFGTPCSLMRDLGRAVIDAAIEFIGDRSIQNLACQLHFLKDIGKDILKEEHDALRDLFKRQKVRSGLASLTRSLGRAIGKDIGDVKAMLDKWLSDERHQPLPDGPSGVVVVRAIAQTVLDFDDDGTDAGFPFDQPMLALYDRCLDHLRVVESLLIHPSKDRAVRRALCKLHAILLPVRSEVPFERHAKILRECAALFQELRGALRIVEKSASREADQPDTMENVREAENAWKKLEESLTEQRPDRGGGKEKRKAIDIILKHLRRHGKYLWGHLITLEDGTTILVARTNVILERFFGKSKRRERRRSGRKNLTKDLEDLPADAFLALNLEKQDYLDIVCHGSIANLVEAFAELDKENRSSSLAVRKAEETRQEDPAVVSASLQKNDRRIVRLDSWRERMRAEARSRSPLLDETPSPKEGAGQP